MKMNRKRAFTLTEIIIVVVISSVILAIMYRIISGTMQQMFKSSTKMTNLRAASIILERIKNDVRCSVIPKNNDDYVINETEFSFYTVSSGKTDPQKVTYKYDPTKGDLTRQYDAEDMGAKILNKAKVKSFSVVPSSDKKYITVTIVTDNEMEKEIRTASSKANLASLTAVLYPRFFPESITDEERFWNYAQMQSQEEE